MPDMPRPRRDPSEWAAFPPAEEPTPAPPQGSAVSEPDTAPYPEQDSLPEPSPFPLPQEPTPTGRQRYVTDTQPMNIPPDAYLEQYGEDSGYEDIGIPDGYDPYDPPRRPKRKRSSRKPDYISETPKRSRPAHKSRRRRSSCLGRLLRFVLVLAAIVFALYSVLSLALISKLDTVPRAPRTVTTGTLGNARYTRSVLLIGTDSRNIAQERGNSDTMILLTFNDASHEVYLSSFLRDTYVDIPNRGWDRLSAAYSYGGPELLMDTLEWNFDLSIDDYICVSFAGFANIVDSVGGVQLHLTDEEAQAINDILQNEVNDLLGDAQEDGLLDSDGDLLLTGKQVLSYIRTRYAENGGSDHARREILEKLGQSMKQRAAQAVPQLITSAKPGITTNMTKSELYLLSLRLPVAFFYPTRQQQIPADGTWSPADANGSTVIEADADANYRVLKNTAYAMSRNQEDSR
ncbi:MAG: LCP family protein [Oscillospiraceae bacterium]|nr:LCP family protein [Oscillospiraceae bacterium]